MAETYSPMWWAQIFAIASNVILWGWVVLALFSPGLYDIIDWLSRVNLRIKRNKIQARHADGRVREDSPALDGHTGSHRLVAVQEEDAE